MVIFNFLWDYIIPFLFILTVLVYVHEMGHYLVARRNGVRVEVFSIGFGPEIYGWTNAAGTRWKISAVPLGGYVKMFGEYDIEDRDDGEEVEMTAEDMAVSFHHKRLGQRSAIVSAGPIANFIFAAFVFAALYSTIGRPMPLAVVGQVMDYSAAAEAGFEAGDRIIDIDGEAIKWFEDLRRIVSASPGKALNFGVLRKDAEISLTASPKLAEYTEDSGITRRVGQLGVGLDITQVGYERVSLLTAAWMGVERTYAMTAQILAYLWEMISGTRTADELGGPIRIAQLSGQMAQGGLFNLFFFMAALSVNLGLINLFPIPMLDGGHLVFYAAEAVRGRPLGPKAQEYGFRFGLVLVFLL